MAGASTKNNPLVVDWIFYIHYLIWFEKNEQIQALINSNNEVNAITLTYVAKLSLKIRHTNVETQKFDDSIHKRFEIVLANH